MISYRDRRTVAAVVIVLASAALACSSETESPVAPTPKVLTRVTINFNPSITYGPLMIAKDEGFFDEEGIDIDFVALDSSTSLAALVDGGLDVLASGVRASIFNLIQRGEPIQVVFGKGHLSTTCSAESYIAPPEMADRIIAAGGSPRGERVAIIRGGIAEFMIEEYLAHYNLTMDDVVAVPLPHGLQYSSGDRVDAVRLIGEPNLSVQLNKNEARVLNTVDEILPKHQSSVLVFGKHLLHDDPDLGRRFMRAYLRGSNQWNTGATDRNVGIVARYTKVSPEVLLQMCWTSTPDDGRIDPHDIQAFFDWALEKQYLDAPVTAEWWNPTFIDDAARSLANGAP